MGMYIIWKRTMGSRMLDMQSFAKSLGAIRLYAACHPDMNGDITALLLNTDPARAVPVDLRPLAVNATGREEWVLTPKDDASDSEAMLLNGEVLALGKDYAL